MRKSVSIVFSLMLLLLVPGFLSAQGVTTGSFSGKVLDVDGNAVAGADIVIVHEPTGTKYRTLARSNGVFNVPAVRVGGPYTITASYEGFKSEKQEGLVVKLGETKFVDFTMQLATVDAGEVLVTASSPVINPSRTGASQNVASDAIENLPTISRDISSFTRLAPQFVSGEDEGSFSAGGRNNRYNNIQIDGAVNNDLFGLAASGTPGGQAETTPISLDAIQEFQIVMAPYDIRHGGFTGGGVNVITKSGTNDFHGSAYLYTRNESLVGDGPNETPFSEFKETIGGVTLGGPLKKNKLFFFLSGEMTRKSEPEQYRIVDGSGDGLDIGIDPADAQRFIEIMNSYGYDPGTTGEIVNDTESNKIFFRLDWNVNDKHILSARHNFVDAKKDILRNSSSTLFTCGNGGYIFNSKTNSTVVQLNSTLGNSMFNELILNYTTIREHRDTMGTPFPEVTVDLGRVDIKSGTEKYSTRNALDQDIIEFTDNLTIYSGKHTFTLGTHNEFIKFRNVFVESNFGVYTFRSLDDFAAGESSYYKYFYSNTGDEDAPAEFSVAQLGVYAGDQWAIHPNVKLTFGVRADVPIIPDDPAYNPLAFEAFGKRTDVNPGGNLLISPRFGFNWDVKGDRQVQIRGGIGLFAGRTPYVWISNQYSNTGIELTKYENYGGLDTFYPDPNNQYAGVPGHQTNEINMIDPDYKMPQVLKTNLAVDMQLPFGFTGTLEGVYSKSINEIRYANLNIEPTGEHASDGRPLYGSPYDKGYYWSWHTNFVDSDNFTNALYLTNTSKGYQYQISAQIQKDWKNGDMVNASYTYGMSKDINSGTSSRAISNWKYNITTGDPDDPPLTYSNFDIRHRIIIAATKTFNFIPNAPTLIGVTYVGRSGRPYSVRYKYDFNGDGASNDSIYVPANADDILLTDPSEWAELDTYISQNPDLDKYRGQILPRNACRDPWVHKVDLKIAQTIPIPGLKGHKLKLTFDIVNLMNLFNKDWGVEKYIQYDDAPLEWKYMNDQGLPVFDFIGDASDKDARYVINELMSRWKAMLGIRYSF